MIVSARLDRDDRLVSSVCLICGYFGVVSDVMLVDVDTLDASFQ